MPAWKALAIFAFLVFDIIVKLPVYAACGAVLAVIWVIERVKTWR